MSGKKNFANENEKYYTIAYAIENYFMTLEFKREQKDDDCKCVKRCFVLWNVYYKLNKEYEVFQDEVKEVYDELVEKGSVKEIKLPSGEFICERTDNWNY